MKFEKINENKIKIILNISDLTEQNIDFHSFMSNPLQSQELFKNLLNNAEKEVGFISKNYNLRIEILSLDNIDFVITLTRLVSDKKTSNYKIKNFIPKTKSQDVQILPAIYCFESFDDLLDFCNSISDINFRNNFTKKIILYFYNNEYYLLIENTDIMNFKNSNIFSIITDFATYIPNPDIFSKRLSEFGKVIINKNSINVILKHFVNKKS